MSLTSIAIPIIIFVIGFFLGWKLNDEWKLFKENNVLENLLKQHQLIK